MSDAGELYCCNGCKSLYEALKAKGIEDIASMQQDPLFLRLREAGLLQGIAAEGSSKKSSRNSSAKNFSQGALPPLSQGSLQESSTLEKRPTPEKRTNEAEQSQLLLTIEGMWCGHCAELLRFLLHAKFPGIEEVWLDYSCDMALIRYNPKECGQELFVREIERWGWSAKPWSLQEERPKKRWEMAKLGLMSALSLQVMMLAYPGYLRDLGFVIDGNLLALQRLSWAMTLPIVALTWPRLLKRTLKSAKLYLEGVLTQKKALATSALQALCGIETLALLSTGAALLLSLFTTIASEMTSMGGGLLEQASSLTRGGFYLETCAFILTYLAWSFRLSARFKQHYVQHLAVMGCKEGARIRKKAAHGGWLFDPLSKLERDELFWAIGQDRLGCDAQVISGSAWIDSSWRSGESAAQLAKEGALVYAGDLLERGCIELRALKSAKDSQQAQLNAQVARFMKGRSQKQMTLTQRLLQRFVPALLLFVLLIGMGGLYLGLPLAVVFERALAMLCIGCPCALSLAEPLLDHSLSLALQSSFGAQLINPQRARAFGSKSRQAPLERYLLDKTGTLTTGTLKLNQQVEEPRALQIAASMACRSFHPLSRHLAELFEKQYVSKHRYAYLPCSNFEEIPSRGLLATIKTSSSSSSSLRFFLGSVRWLEEQLRLGAMIQISAASPLLKEALHAVEKPSAQKKKKNRGSEASLQPSSSRWEPFFSYIERHTHLLLVKVQPQMKGLKLSVESFWSFQEELRPGSFDLVERLGASRCLLVTGDQRASAEKIAARLEIAQVHALCSPIDKVLLTQRLREASTGVSLVMIGDGINDSGALSHCDLGIVLTHRRLGALGSLLAADLQLPASHLLAISDILQLLRKGAGTAKSNIAFASVYNFFALFFAASGYLSPFVSALAMIASSIALIFNTFKILLFKK